QLGNFQLTRRFDEVIPLLEPTVADRERVPRPGHPHTIGSATTRPPPTNGEAGLMMQSRCSSVPSTTVSGSSTSVRKRRGVRASRSSRLARMSTPVRYRSEDEDSGRWLAFPFRPGDIVISTRSKSGTTWMQMICALLIFQTADLPAPLPRLSPWLDWVITRQQQVYEQLAAQRHRRFIKTHTPLDGLPIVADVSYLVVARHPLDMAVSLYHQGNNINRERLRQL